MPVLELKIVGGGRRLIPIHWVFNGGYAGRDQAQVQHHIDELGLLGIPAPKTVPTLYGLANFVVSQNDVAQVQHARTSGEAEWALIVGEHAGDLLVAAACDHTDRTLETHGVAWSKQAAPDFIGDTAWPYAAVADSFDRFTLRGWVHKGGREELIQDGSPGLLLPPSYWIDRLKGAGLLRPGTLLMSGTIPMKADVDQFADSWRVELDDGQGHVSRVSYRVERLADPWE